MKMVKTCCVFLAVLLTNKAMSQSQDEGSNVNGSRTHIGIYTGCWMPVGRLAAKINPAPSFEINFTLGSRTSEVPSAEAYINFFAPTSRPFYYTSGDTIVLTRASFGIAAGLRWVEEIPLAEQNFFDFIALSAGMGFQSIVVDYKEKKDEDEALAGFCFQAGATFSKRIWQTRFIGLTAHYNFVPSRMMARHVGRDFGSNSINVGLEYRF